MQIDFHHGTTYVLARWAGFSHAEADVIAYAAQYVDDAVKKGVVIFDNGARYKRRSSAHRLITRENIDEDGNRETWAVFHFLPGNAGCSHRDKTNADFITRMICLPNSAVAQELLEECIAEKRRPYSLQRLGITAHVYADTWAHAGFTGVVHDVNKIDIQEECLRDGLCSEFAENLPLGHGMALCYPDHPWRSWKYIDYQGNLVTKNNTEDFLKASDALLKFFRRYHAGDANKVVEGLSDWQRDSLRQYFLGWNSEDGEERHREWLKGIIAGDFDFKCEHLEYQPIGPASWKAHALQAAEGWEDLDTIYTYNEEFINSNWKLFHDALEAHAFFVMRELLPRYGLCVG